MDSTVPGREGEARADELDRSGAARALQRIRRLGDRLTWIAESSDRVRVRIPFTGETLAEVPLSGPADLDAAVSRARAAALAWKYTPLSDRARILDRFRALLAARAEEVLDVLQLETGKARRHAFEEVVDVQLAAGYCAKAGPRLLRRRRHPGAVPGLTNTSTIVHPIGVVGVIAPWNYPLSLSISDSLPAVLAGNAVIVKPDVQTTYTALAALELFLEAGLPEAVLQVVPGDGPGTGAGLVDRVDYLAFTGSTATGRRVARRAAERLIGCSLELGGKNPMIVRLDSELERAVAGAIRGAFTNAGQLCISTERIYVHEDLFDLFVSAFAERAQRLKLGAGLDYEADIGSLTHGHQLGKTDEHVRDAVGKGAEVRAGGRARPDIGPLFYEPTVLTGVTPGMRLYAEETFGPVVSVYPFHGDDEAVAMANDSSYGLTASIWSRDVGAALRMAGQLQVGAVSVNESYSAAWGSVDAPFGGVKDSGTGRRHGPEGILKYTYSQVAAVQRGLPLDLSGPWLQRKAARDLLLFVSKRFRPGVRRP